MAKTATYSLIASTTLASTAAFIEFTSISGAYTDLVLVAQIIGGSGGNDCLIRLNSDTGSNYSNTAIWGSGSAAASGRNSNATSVFGNITSIENGEINTMIVSFNDYSNSTTFKTTLNRYNSTTAGKFVVGSVGLWRNTNPITAIKVDTGGNGTYSIGTNIKLYGIEAGNL